MPLDMQDYANLGSAVLTGDSNYVGAIDKQALRARNQSNELRKLIAYALPTPDNMVTRIDGPIIGWTTPSLTYDKQRQINASALALNFDIEKNVTNNDAFKSAWNEWFKNWQTFFNKYQTPGVFGDGPRWGVLLDTDLLAAQTESWRVQLVGDKEVGEVGWIAKYEALSTPEHPIPPSTAPSVPKITPDPPGTDPQNGQTTTPLPWWVITLFVVGGVGAVAGTFFLFRRKAIEAEQAQTFIRHDVLPIVLGSAMGPTGVAFAHAANNRFAGPGNDPGSSDR